MKINEVRLHEMKLNEVAYCTMNNDTNDFMVIIRVPGGWIYKYADPSNGIDLCYFVNYNEEFKKI